MSACSRWRALTRPRSVTILSGDDKVPAAGLRACAAGMTVSVVTTCAGTGRVRRADVDDARTIAEIHVRSWQAAYAGQLPDRLLERLSIADLETAWQLRLSAPPRGSLALLIDREPGHAVGFASIGPSRDCDADGHTGEVQALYVDPAYWRQGLGGKLLRAASSALSRNGFRVATLWVLRSHRAAQRFYVRAGWVPDGAVTTDRIDGCSVEVVRFARALDEQPLSPGPTRCARERMRGQRGGAGTSSHPRARRPGSSSRRRSA
jgi:GNAT superfamily N-acetyltransferase